MSALVTDPDVLRSHAEDVSGLHLEPESVARPRTLADVVEIVSEVAAQRGAITPAGAHTSTTAASITDRGTLLSMNAMSGIIDIDVPARRVRAFAGTILSEVKQAVASEGLLLPPDPTSEASCTVAGAVACNASGARSLRYGATRPWVSGLTAVMADGSVHELRRTRLEKNTAGLAFAQDPIDWFVGSEGILGVITEVEFSVLQAPEQTLGLAIPFSTEADALAFVVAARESGLHPQALEYFDDLALAIARSAEHDASWASEARALVYVEMTADGGDAVPIDRWLALAQSHAALEGDIRSYDSEAAIRSARGFRHAIPATMNERGAQRRAHGGRKVSTDWAVPYPRLHDAIRQARSIAERHGVPQSVIYGHAGNGHPHQNFIAHDADELHRIEAVIEETLHAVITMGGTVSAEHGIGKLKRRWLPLQMTSMQITAMRALKHALDPHGLFAPGNIFE